MKLQDTLRGPAHPQFRETSSRGSSKDSGSRAPVAALRLLGTRALAASLGASPQPARPGPATRAALCPGARRPGPRAGLAAALPGQWARAHAGRSAAGQGCLHRKGRLLLGPGLTRGRRHRAGAATGCARSGARTSGAPDPAVRRSSPPGGGGGQKTLPRPDSAPRPALHAAYGRLLAGQSFSAPRGTRLTWEAGHQRAEPEQAGVQGRRGPRHGGGARPQRWRGRRAPRGPGAEAGARGPRARGRSRMPGSQPPWPGGRSWRLRWPAPRHHHPSRSARSRVPGLPEDRGSGRPRRAALGRGGAGSAQGQRLGLRDAQPHSALLLRPFPSSLPPARLHFPPPSLLPFSPHSKPQPGCHTVSLQRGGASSGPGQLRPARGPARGRGARGAQVQVPYRALAGGPEAGSGGRSS